MVYSLLLAENTRIASKTLRVLRRNSFNATCTTRMRPRALTETLDIWTYRKAGCRPGWELQLLSAPVPNDGLDELDGHNGVGVQALLIVDGEGPLHE